MFPRGAFLFPGKLIMNHSLIDTDRIPSAFVEEAMGQYKAVSVFSEDDILQAAKCIWSRRLVTGDIIDSVQKIKCFFEAQLASIEYEVFCVAFLTTRHRMIACEQMFRGTINDTTIYPRELIKRVLSLNAAAVIFAHNHPSGDATPSQQDKFVTEKLCQALSFISVNVLDHIVVGDQESISFAEIGLLENSPYAVKSFNLL